MKRLAYNVHQIVNKLYSTIPLVPSGNLIQNIMQDIQYGLYDECGDPDKNWDKWKARCIELLKQRKILGSKILIADHDAGTRDSAMIYIDGKFYEDSAHNFALNQYMNEMDLTRKFNPENNGRANCLNEVYRHEALKNLQFGCMHKVDQYNNEDIYTIYIDEDSCENITPQELAQIIKLSYPNYSVCLENYALEPYETDKYEKLAKLTKQNYHDNDDRDCAIVYIDGLFFEAETHNEALTLYTNENKIRRTNNPSSYKREVLEDELYNNKSFKDKEFCCLNKVLFDPIEKKDVKRIFIDDETLQNISLNQLVSNIQSYYSGFDIYIDNNNACAHDIDEYVKVANFNKEYSWEEICQITDNAGGKIYSLPFGDYSDCYFKLEYVDIDLISGYMTYDEYKEYDLDEDMSIVEYLAGKYDDGEDIPPIILDNDYSIIDGSHRASMYDYFGLNKIKAFVLYEGEPEVVNL